MTTTLAVAPIIVGYPFSQVISFVDGSGNPPAGFDLRTASRIVGSIRLTPGSSNPVLAQFDSTAAPPTLVVTNATTMAFSLTIAETWNLAPATPPTGATEPTPTPVVWIDFAREDSGIWSLLPMQLQWPVLTPVTAPPQ